MKQLFLGDFEGKAEDEIRAYIKENYTDDPIINKEETPDSIDNYEILIVWEDDGGYEGGSFFMLKSKKDNKIYCNFASHCSCYGFEDQFDLEETSLEYLKSINFDPCVYDDNDYSKVMKYISELEEVKWKK